MTSNEAEILKKNREIWIAVQKTLYQQLSEKNSLTSKKIKQTKNSVKLKSSYLRLLWNILLRMQPHLILLILIMLLHPMSIGRFTRNIATAFGLTSRGHNS